MRKYIILLAILPLLAAFTRKPLPATPAAGVYLYVSGITTGCGTALGHPDEVELLSVGNGFIVPPGSGTPSSGNPELSEMVIAKMFDKASLRIQYYALKKDATKDFEIKYYDGISSSEVYKIVARKATIRTATSSNADCGGAGCPGIAESYSFLPTKIEWHNLKTVPAQVLTFDLVTHEVILTP